jgi:hypothetical protein
LVSPNPNAFALPNFAVATQKFFHKHQTALEVLPSVRARLLHTATEPTGGTVDVQLRLLFSHPVPENDVSVTLSPEMLSPHTGGRSDSSGDTEGAGAGSSARPGADASSGATACMFLCGRLRARPCARVFLSRRSHLDTLLLVLAVEDAPGLRAHSESAAGRRACATLAAPVPPFVLHCYNELDTEAQDGMARASAAPGAVALPVVRGHLGLVDVTVAVAPHVDVVAVDMCCEYDVAFFRARAGLQTAPAAATAALGRLRTTLLLDVAALQRSTVSSPHEGVSLLLFSPYVQPV